MATRAPPAGLRLLEQGSEKIVDQLFRGILEVVAARHLLDHAVDSIDHRAGGRGYKTRAEILLWIIDRPGQADGGPEISIARNGEHFFLRTGQPLQARGSHADLKCAVDKGILNHE